MIDESQDPDRYLSLRSGEEVEIREKASRFLGRAHAVSSHEEAAQRLDDVRRLYHDARHHCWALRLGPPEACVERSEDDREPSKTAGPPILRALQGAGVFDAFVVVTRYFGGTKLGTGGLVRAYGETAALALAKAPRRIVLRYATVEAACDYQDLGAVESVLAQRGDVIDGVTRDFGGLPKFSVRILRSHAPGLTDTMKDATGGRVLFHEVVR